MTAAAKRAALPAPPPLRNPTHPGRQMRAVICPVCLQAFRPWRGGSADIYCTTECWGRARREAAVLRREQPTPEELHEQIYARCMAAHAELVKTIEAREASDE